MLIAIVIVGLAPSMPIPVGAALLTMSIGPDLIGSLPGEIWFRKRGVEKTMANYEKLLGNAWFRRSYFLSHSFAVWTAALALELWLAPSWWLIEMPASHLSIGPIALGWLTHLVYDLPTHKGDPWRMRPFYGITRWQIPANWGFANVYFRKDIWYASWMIHGTIILAILLFR